MKGNLAEAGAALAAAGSGDSGIPELRMARVHRESQNVSHRVAAVFGDAEPAASSLLAAAEPALAAWLESLLPRVERVAGLGARAAAEVLALAPTGGELQGSRLGAVVLGLAPVARRRRGPSPPSDESALEELAVVAGALRTAVGQARAPAGRGPGRAGDPSPEPDLDELDRRRLVLADRLDELAAHRRGRRHPGGPRGRSAGR